MRRKIQTRVSAYEKLKFKVDHSHHSLTHKYNDAKRVQIVAHRTKQQAQHPVWQQ